MKKIINFKNKTEKLKEWLDNCKKDFENNPPESALLIWESKDEKGICRAFHSKYNCDFQTLSYFTKCLEDKVIEMQIGNYLEEYLKDFIE